MAVLETDDPRRRGEVGIWRGISSMAASGSSGNADRATCDRDNRAESTRNEFANIGQRKRDKLMVHIFNRRAPAGMHSLMIAAVLLVPFFASSTLGADQRPSGPETEKMTAGAAAAMAKLPYPAEVSLIHRRTGWLFRASPSNLRLYAYDADPSGKSVCTGQCAITWPPLIAPAGAMPLGEWTVVVRDDGRNQWAYKSHPAYTRSDASPDKPAGNGIDGAWHFLEP